MFSCKKFFLYKDWIQIQIFPVFQSLAIFVVVVANIWTCILGILACLSLITFMGKKRTCMSHWLLFKVKSEKWLIYMMARSSPVLTELLFFLLKGYLGSFLSFIRSFGNIIYILIKSWFIFTKLPKSCLISISN